MKQASQAVLSNLQMGKGRPAHALAPSQAPLAAVEALEGHLGS